MKKYFVLYIVVFGCFAGTSFAQMKINKPPAQQKPLLQIPMVHITPVSSLFVPVHIDTVKPFTISLNPIIFGKHESPACAYFKKFKPTLVLKAERATDVASNLGWETKYAFYATSFDVERSLGDSLHFETVNFAPVSKATSFKVNYHLPDYNDYSGLSFYRIKQRNGDSGFVYSNIVAVNGIQRVPFKVYPIPATNRVWINITPKQSGKLSITVYDLSGKIILQQSAACTGNSATEKSIDISKLASGLYQVHILMPDKATITGKFIKQ